MISPYDQITVSSGGDSSAYTSIVSTTEKIITFAHGYYEVFGETKLTI